LSVSEEEPQLQVTFLVVKRLQCTLYSAMNYRHERKYFQLIA